MNDMAERKKLTRNTIVDVLTEAGYRCGVPTCRQILAIDLHHIVEVSAGGGNDVSNLLALCPTCHALFHRGTISRESIYAWKAVLVSLSQAFDTEAIDALLFLAKPEVRDLFVTGDGVLRFSRLISAGLVNFKLYYSNGPLFSYSVRLTRTGQLLIDAWTSGDRESVRSVFSEPGGLAAMTNSAVSSQ